LVSHFLVKPSDNGGFIRGFDLPSCGRATRAVAENDVLGRDQSEAGVASEREDASESAAAAALEDGSATNAFGSDDATAAAQQLLDAVEGLEEGVAVFDAADTLVLCNTRYRQIHSAIADRLTPRTTFEAVLRSGIERGLYPAAIGSEEEWLRERLADHRAGNSHFERQGSDGHWLQILEQRTPGGGTTILATDITEVKRRELALVMLAVAGQDGGDFFADAVVSLAAGIGYRCAAILWLDAERAAVTPRAFCESGIVGAGDAFAVTGTPCETVLEERGFWAIDRDVTQHYPQDEVLRRRRAVAFVGDLINDAAGRPIGLVYAVTDKPDRHASKRRDTVGLIAARISLEVQRREAEDELRKAKEAAESASRAKSQLLANMSHELRTPLNAIIGFSQMIGDEALGPAGRTEYRDYARDINVSSQNLLQIINDVLDVSKIEAGTLTLREEEFDPAAFLQDCRRLVAPRAESAGISLETGIPNELPILVGDERMLRRAMLNLLSNALKFTPKGGTVAIAAHEEAAGVVFTVRDTGIGIAETDFTKIFHPFIQADGGLDRKFEGTGLGLPLARGIIELHRGTIAVASAVGQGTTMSVRLPLPNAACREAAAD
jgi:signal transduction histidine kinase